MNANNQLLAVFLENLPACVQAYEEFYDICFIILLCNGLDIPSCSDNVEKGIGFNFNFEINKVFVPWK